MTINTTKKNEPSLENYAAITSYRAQGHTFREPYCIFDNKAMNANHIYVSITRATKLSDVHFANPTCAYKWEKQEYGIVNSIIPIQDKALTPAQEKALEKIKITTSQLKQRFGDNVLDKCVKLQPIEIPKPKPEINRTVEIQTSKTRLRVVVKNGNLIAFTREIRYGKTLTLEEAQYEAEQEVERIKKQDQIDNNEFIKDTTY